jgi:hypothetical protein
MPPVPLELVLLLELMLPLLDELLLVVGVPPVPMPPVLLVPPPPQPVPARLATLMPAPSSATAK